MSAEHYQNLVIGSGERAKYIAWMLAKSGQKTVVIMKESAGTLLYRLMDDRLEVLLVHPSGNYNRKAPWGIPKGMPDEGEDLETAARRETIEEAAVTPGKLVSLSSISYQKSRKRVHCFAGEAPKGSEPRCASWEIDQAAFLPVDEARRRIHPDQSPFLDRLIELLGRR